MSEQRKGFISLAERERRLRERRRDKRIQISPWVPVTIAVLGPTIGSFSLMMNELAARSEQRRLAVQELSAVIKVISDESLEYTFEALSEQKEISSGKLTSPELEAATKRVASLRESAQTTRENLKRYWEMAAKLSSPEAWMYWVPSLQDARAQLEQEERSERQYLDAIKTLDEAIRAARAREAATSGSEDNSPIKSSSVTAVRAVPAKQKVQQKPR